MKACTPTSQEQQRACPRHFTNFLYSAIFSAHKSAVSCCKITRYARHTVRLQTKWKLGASISIKKLFAQGEPLGGLSRDGGEKRKRNKKGLRNTVKAFNHRRAVRPRFSPTGAKRQMGSITALGGHTHTHDFHCYFNKGNTA